MLFDGGAYCEYRQLGALQKYPPYHAWYLGSRVQNNPGMRIPPGLGNGHKKGISFERIPWVQIILSQGRLILTFFLSYFHFSNIAWQVRKVKCWYFFFIFGNNESAFSSHPTARQQRWKLSPWAENHFSIFARTAPWKKWGEPWQMGLTSMKEG